MGGGDPPFDDAEERGVADRWDADSVSGVLGREEISELP
jgi:hypothetical protein